MYVPQRGDIIWLNFSPQTGREQAGRRPALVISPIRYNRRVGLALVCPITTKVKGYTFEVPIPEGLPRLNRIIEFDFNLGEIKVKLCTIGCARFLHPNSNCFKVPI
ncbi:type II toxin-antitoxin system PemK/MazF family toxin [Coleofasciculus sp.]|uniref:type II toxin-antitoxin system PemK/MazF family toxin n=1 Tax=Coleofasciculus sp. TaxID=3100458 RepID=UPI003A4402AA